MPANDRVGCLTQSPAAAASDGIDDRQRSMGQCEVICFAAGAGSNWLTEWKDFVEQLTRRFEQQEQRGQMNSFSDLLWTVWCAEVEVQFQC